jgi:hypothetical protein
LDGRAQYNLACYYARRGDEAPPGSTEQTANYARAFENLLEAIETASPDLAKWALKDPALAGLQAHVGPPGFQNAIAAAAPP